jgi:AraC-like DNA-binding protein
VIQDWDWVAGRRAPESMLPVLGPLMFSASTLRQTYAAFLRYVPLLVEGMSWQLSEEGERAVFGYRCVQESESLTRFTAEFVLASALRAGVKLLSTNKVVPTQVCFQHDTPAYSQRYARVFGCPVAFRCASNALVFDRQLLDRPHAYEDVAVHVAMKNLAETTLSQLEHRPASLTERIELMLQTDVAATANSASELADRMGLTVRQLRRRLSREGVKIADLLEDARQRRACEELRHGHSIEEVAERLGFSERSAFHRAFRRWTGKTPQQYVDQNRHRLWNNWS